MQNRNEDMKQDVEENFQAIAAFAVLLNNAKSIEGINPEAILYLTVIIKHFLKILSQDEVKFFLDLYSRDGFVAGFSKPIYNTQEQDFIGFNGINEPGLSRLGQHFMFFRNSGQSLAELNKIIPYNNNNPNNP